MRTIGFFLLFFALTAHAHEFDVDLNEEQKVDQKILFVSLGSNCEVAIYMRECKLRNTAFPFDWLLSYNHQAFLSLLRNDFHFLLDDEHWFLHPDFSWRIENRLYEIEFRHDLPLDIDWNDRAKTDACVREMREKYTRRIERFRALAHYPDNSQLLT